MAKMKTNRSAKKRFLKTARGKIFHFRSNRRHLLQKKNSARKRRLQKKGEVYRGEYGKIKQLLPYL